MPYYDKPANRQKKKTFDGKWEEEGTRYRRPDGSARRGGASRPDSRSAGDRRFGPDASPDRRVRRNGPGEHNRPYGEDRPYQSRGRQDRPQTRGPRPSGPRFRREDSPRFERREAPQERTAPTYTDFEYENAQPVLEDAQAQPNENLLAGRNPIREAIKSGRDIEKLLVMKGELSGSARQIVAMAREARIPVQEVEKSRLDEITPHHQGMLAFASAYSYSTVEEMLSLAAERGEDPFLVILDGVTDPHNLGAIIRSAECVGAHGVVVRERRSVGLTPAAVKASAGAIEHVKVARVPNLNRTLEDLKKAGMWIYAVTMDGEDYQQVDFAGGVALVIGSEGEGISRLTLENCDRKVSLPMRGELDSLNASVAAGVMMYRVLACRKP